MLLNIFAVTRPVSTYVKVVELQLGQGIVQSGLNVLGAVVGVPQLGGDEDVLTLQAGDVGEGLLDALADLLLVTVDLGQVEVAVASLQGLVDTGADLTGGGLPGAVAQEGDLVAGAESGGLSCRHCEVFGSDLVSGKKGKGYMVQ